MGCEKTVDPQAIIQQAKEEILNAEEEFAKMAKEQGVNKAFEAYAAENGVIARNDEIIQGREAIRNYFEASSFTEVVLQWKPDFVDASASGDLGYTYGKFDFSGKDAEGNPINATGIKQNVERLKTSSQFVEYMSVVLVVILLFIVAGAYTSIRRVGNDKKKRKKKK